MRSSVEVIVGCKVVCCSTIVGTSVRVVYSVVSISEVVLGAELVMNSVVFVVKSQVDCCSVVVVTSIEVVYRVVITGSVPDVGTSVVLRTDSAVVVSCTFVSSGFADVVVASKFVVAIVSKVDCCSFVVGASLDVAVAGGVACSVLDVRISVVHIDYCAVVVFCRVVSSTAVDDSAVVRTELVRSSVVVAGSEVDSCTVVGTSVVLTTDSAVVVSCTVV